MTAPGEPTIPDLSAPIPQATRRIPWESTNGTQNGHSSSNGYALTLPPEPDIISRSRSIPASNLPDGEFSLSGVSLRAFALGTALGGSLITTVFLLLNNSPLWRTPFFITSLSLFHFLEFYVTALYNAPAANTGAFLLSANGMAYNAAHTLALLETTLTHSGYWSGVASLPPSVQPLVLPIGLVLLLVGQVVRTKAMAQAGTNFNHTIQKRRATGHELVETGVYRVLRHPSYFGFFWWGLGTQVVLGNGVCFVGYAAVLWVFFWTRIKSESTEGDQEIICTNALLGEEEYLEKFFGEQYVRYRARTRVGIPLIR